MHNKDKDISDIQKSYKLILEKEKDPIKKIMNDIKEKDPIKFLSNKDKAFIINIENFIKSSDTGNMPSIIKQFNKNLNDFYKSKDKDDAKDNILLIRQEIKQIMDLLKEIYYDKGE